MNGSLWVKTSQNVWPNFFLLSINLIHIIDSGILHVLIIWKLLYLGKNNLWKMEVLQIFVSWDQETESWFFTNHEPLIPTLYLWRLKPATFWHWTKGSRAATSEGPTVPHIHFYSYPFLQHQPRHDNNIP